MEQYIKGFKGFTPVKMCGLSPLASFYLVATEFYEVGTHSPHIQSVVRLGCKQLNERP